jgi:hypothetical protein
MHENVMNHTVRCKKCFINIDILCFFPPVADRLAYFSIFFSLEGCGYNLLRPTHGSVDVRDGFSYKLVSLANHPYLGIPTALCS